MRSFLLLRYIVRYLLVDNVGHAVSDEDIRDNNLGRVDKNAAVANGDLDRTSLEGGD